MKTPLIQFFTILLIIFSCGKKKYADTIIFGGTIYTVDSLNSKTESVAIKNGKILKTGNYSNLGNLISSKTKKINLDGKTMIPGFIEGHGHIMGV